MEIEISMTVNHTVPNKTSAKFQVDCFESNCYTNQNQYQSLRN